MKPKNDINFWFGWWILWPCRLLYSIVCGAIVAGSGIANSVLPEEFSEWNRRIDKFCKD